MATQGNNIATGDHGNKLQPLEKEEISTISIIAKRINCCKSFYSIFSLILTISFWASGQGGFVRNAHEKPDLCWRLGRAQIRYIFNFFSQRHKSYCYVFSKKALSCSLNICSRSYSRCLVEKAAISSLVWKYGNSFSHCESSAPSNSNWDKKFGWVFDKVAILGSNLKFPPSICKPQQQGPNPVQLTFNLENSKFLDLLPVQYLFYRELSGRLPGSHTLIIPSREYLLISMQSWWLWT